MNGGDWAAVTMIAFACYGIGHAARVLFREDKPKPPVCPPCPHCEPKPCNCHKVIQL